MSAQKKRLFAVARVNAISMSETYWRSWSSVMCGCARSRARTSRAKMRRNAQLATVMPGVPQNVAGENVECGRNLRCLGVGDRVDQARIIEDAIAGFHVTEETISET